MKFLARFLISLLIVSLMILGAWQLERSVGWLLLDIVLAALLLTFITESRL
jgi:hypothetical protein